MDRGKAKTSSKLEPSMQKKELIMEQGLRLGIKESWVDQRIKKKNKSCRAEILESYENE